VRNRTPVATPVVPAPRLQPGFGRAGGAERPLLVPPVSLVSPVGEFELVRGWLVIGRLPECSVCLDDTLVSRMHARIIVQEGLVLVEDLHSSNGVYLNGVRVAGSSSLREGDRILVGTTELSIFEVSDSGSMKVHPPSSTKHAAPRVESGAPQSGGRAKSPVRPLTSLKLSKGASTRPPASRPPASRPPASRPPASRPPASRPAERARTVSFEKVPTTTRATALQMIGSLADRLFANGEVEEAVYVMSGHLRRILQGANGGLQVPPDVAALASHYAMVVARRSNQAIWMDYVVELHLSARLVMASSTLLEFQDAAARGSSYDRLLFDYYVEAMLKRVADLSADEQARVELIALFGERS